MEAGDRRPIGVFDSGVGGISVLREAIKALPGEDFIYFGDNGNAPYGGREESEILRLTNVAVDKLLAQDIKALVIACNTATSAAIGDLRRRLEIPVIGMEPAVKPAITQFSAEKVYVMATQATLRLQKFNDLVTSFSESAEIVAVPCPGLMEIIEQAIVRGEPVKDYLDVVFRDRMPNDGDVVVLGCTHYVFLMDFLASYFPAGVEIIDGNHGTVNQLIHKLQEGGIRNNRDSGGELQLITTGDEEKVLSIFNRLLSL